MYVDSHTHFDLVAEYCHCEADALVSALAEHAVAAAVQISIDAASLQWSFDFAKKHRDKGIRCSLGIHPSSSAGDAELAALAAMTESAVTAHRDLVFGIGETGLDFYRMRQPRALQMRSFEYQLHLASRYNLPVIIHSRDAFDDTIAMIAKNRLRTGIMHCFPGNGAQARQALDLGMYLSFAGNCTYPSAANLHEAARLVPLDRLLVETDAPFLTPVPFRGKTNKPEYIAHTYGFIADLRKEDPETLMAAVCQNFSEITTGAA